MNQPASPLSPRRKPRQTRSRTTADAIAEAFLQLLMEKGYDKVSIRQIVNLAGVGIGSFYEYFSSKASVAAVCVHLRVKGVAQKMKAAVAARSDSALPDRVDAMITAQVADVMAEPRQWAALLLIERQVSPLEVHQRMYGEFVTLWARCLSAGPDWPADAPLDHAALTAHAITYGLVTQSLIAFDAVPQQDALLRQLRFAVHGYLSVLAPHAYRFHRFE